MPEASTPAGGGAEGPATLPDPTGPGLGAELLGIVYVRSDPIDGGPLGLVTLGGLVSLDAEAALGPLFSPEYGTRLAVELLLVRTAWGADEGTDALAVSQSAWLTSPRLRAGWAFGQRLQLQPFLALGPALTRTEVAYTIDDPAVSTTIQTTRAGWLFGLTGAGGVLVSWPLTPRLLLLGRLELDVVRRGGTTDAAFAAGLGLQLGHVTPRAR